MLTLITKNEFFKRRRHPVQWFVFEWLEYKLTAKIRRLSNKCIFLLCVTFVITLNAPNFVTGLLTYGCFRVDIFAQQVFIHPPLSRLYFPSHFPLLYLPSNLISSLSFPLLFIQLGGLGKRFMVKRNKNNTFQDINHTQCDKSNRMVTAGRQIHVTL